MALLDHFNPPLSRTHPWRSVHEAWAAAMSLLLNQGVLLPGYYAVPPYSASGLIWEKPMTDLRNLTIIALMGRLNMLIDEGESAPTPAEVKRYISDRTILSRLSGLYGDFPEFSPFHKAEAILLLKELRTVVDIYDGREEMKMGVKNNGLCLLIGYCIEMLQQRHIGEILG